MSYVFSESYIKQKLRRLEETNDYNRTKLAMFNIKKTFMSRNEYERYKRILFGTDYSSERESLQNSQNKEFIQNNLKRQQKSSPATRSSKSKRKNSPNSLIPGSIVSSSGKQNKSPNIRIQDGNFNGGYNMVNQKYNNKYQDHRYATPKQENNGQYEHLDQIGQNSRLNEANMVTFNSAGAKTNVQNAELNQDSVFQQSQNYEEFDLEQQQLMRNIKKIENEKQELENELYQLQVKAENLHLYTKSKSQKSIFEDAFKNSESIFPQEFKSLTNLRRASPTKQSPQKLKNTYKVADDSQAKIPNYRQMQKKIGLDFETQWNMLDKWESLNQKYSPINDNLYSTAPVYPSYIKHEENQQFIEQNKITFWDMINKIKKQKQVKSQQKKQVHSFLPQEQSWEAKFNKIGKTQEERQTIIDNDINFGTDLLVRKGSLPKVNKYVVNKYTIDRLSDDIDMLMRYSRLSNSPFSSLKNRSPFKLKRSLFEIPEEQYSQDNSVNY